MSDLPGAASFSTSPGEMKPKGEHARWCTPDSILASYSSAMAEAIERVYEALDEADAGGGDVNFLTTRHIRELLDPKLKEARDHEQGH